MSISFSVLDNNHTTGADTQFSTAIVNPTSGSKIYLMFSVRSSDLANVGNDTHIISGCAEHWRILNRRNYDTSTRMASLLYEGYGTFTSESINITTYVSRSYGGKSWMVVEASSDVGSVEVVQYGQGFNQTATGLTASLQPFAQAGNTTALFATSDYFGNTQWTSSAGYTELLNQSGSQFSKYFGYKNSEDTNPAVFKTLNVETMAFSSELEEVTTPVGYGEVYYLGQYIATASSFTHTKTFSILGGTNRTLILFHAQHQSGDVTGATFDSSSIMTLISSSIDAVGDARIRTYYHILDNSIPAGEYPVGFTVGSNMVRTGFHLLQLNNVTPIGPVSESTVRQSNGTDTPRHTPITASRGGVLVGHSFTNSTGSMNLGGALKNKQEYIDFSNFYSHAVGHNVSYADNYIVTMSVVPYHKTVFSSNNLYLFTTEAPPGGTPLVGDPMVLGPLFGSEMIVGSFGPNIVIRGI